MARVAQGLWAGSRWRRLCSAVGPVPTGSGERGKIGGLAQIAIHLIQAAKLSRQPGPPLLNPDTQLHRPYKLESRDPRRLSSARPLVRHDGTLNPGREQ